MDKALAEASCSYKGFFKISDDPTIICAKQLATAEVTLNLLDADFLLE